MPDYPYVYDTNATRPVEYGGARLRVFRRRGREDEGGEPDDHSSHGDYESKWREMLRQAVDDLNDAFRRSGAAFLCALDEDESGFCLRVFRLGAGGPGSDAMAEGVDEEVVNPEELPLWLSRLRSRLGLLVDETA